MSKEKWTRKGKDVYNNDGLHMFVCKNATEAIIAVDAHNAALPEPEEITLIERVARALCDNEGHRYDKMPDADKVLWNERAEIVLKTMRNPTTAMLDASTTQLHQTEANDYGLQTWQAMIDAALNRGALMTNVIHIKPPPVPPLPKTHPILVMNELMKSFYYGRERRDKAVQFKHGEVHSSRTGVQTYLTDPADGQVYRITVEPVWGKDRYEYTTSYREFESR